RRLRAWDPANSPNGHGGQTPFRPRCSWRPAGPGGSRSRGGWRVPSRHLLELLQRAQELRPWLAGMGVAPVGVAHIAHIDVAAAVAGKPVRRQETARLLAGTLFAAETGDHRALLVDNAEAWPEVGMLGVHRHARPQLADDEVRILAAAAAIESARPVHVVPLQLVLAVAVEHLHAMVLAVGDIDPAVLVGGDVVRDVELPGIGPGGAPAHQVFAVGRVFVDAGIAVSVRHVDLALGRERGVGAAIERLAAQEGCGLVGHADGQQHLALGGHLADRVVAVVGAVEGVVAVDMDAVRATEQAFAPRAQEVALAVEYHHGMLTAVEDVHVVLAVDRDRRDIAELPAVGQLRPVLHDALTMRAGAYGCGHVFLLWTLAMPSSPSKSSPPTSASGNSCWRRAPRGRSTRRPRAAPARPSRGPGCRPPTSDRRRGPCGRCRRHATRR